MGKLVMANKLLKTILKSFFNAVLNSNSNAVCDGGKNAPAGLYTKFNVSSLPSIPYPTSLSICSALILSSNTPSPRCLSVRSAL